MRIFKRLQDADFSCEWIHKLDNWDCWNLVCSVAKSRPGRVRIIKVKAHCTAKSGQDPYLTYGKSMVDAAARAVARDAFRAKLEPYRKLITVAVSWQCHIIDQPPGDPTPVHLFPEQCNNDFLTKCENGIVRLHGFDRVWDVHQSCRDSVTPVIVQLHVFFLSWTSGVLRRGCSIIRVSTSRLCRCTLRMSVLSFWSISKGLRSPGSCCFSTLWVVILIYLRGLTA